MILIIQNVKKKYIYKNEKEIQTIKYLFYDFCSNIIKHLQ